MEFSLLCLAFSAYLLGVTRHLVVVVELTIARKISHDDLSAIQVTTPELKSICKAKMFSHIGKRTPVAIRFSTVGYPCHPHQFAQCFVSFLESNVRHLRFVSREPRSKTKHVLVETRRVHFLQSCVRLCVCVTEETAMRAVLLFESIGAFHRSSLHVCTCSFSRRAPLPPQSFTCHYGPKVHPCEMQYQRVIVSGAIEPTDIPHFNSGHGHELSRDACTRVLSFDAGTYTRISIPH